jgi:uncharacterized protein YjbI with pentapeptide repeats
MANATHLEILRPGAGQWNDWRKAHSRAPSRVIPDLSSAHLDKSNLRAYDRSRANLANAILRRILLAEADISDDQHLQNRFERAKISVNNEKGKAQ